MTGGWRGLVWGGVCLACAGCGTARVAVPDIQLRNYVEKAQAAHDEGQEAQAAELYGKALARARLMALPEEAGRNAYNQAVCRMALGQPDEALSLLRESRLLLAGSAQERARACVAEAEVERTLGAPSNAWMMASAALADGAAGDVLRAQVLLAELQTDAGKYEDARAGYRTALKHVDDRTAPGVLARLDALAVRLIRAGAVKGDAAALLERRAQWLRMAGQYRTMAETLVEAGRAYTEAGHDQQALRCWFSAARSFEAMGQHAQAKAVAATAVELARKTGSIESMEHAALLTEAIGP